MKKSCSGKESKVVTTKDVDGLLNELKEENLTEEQIYINKKLSESGIKDEGLGWLEKRHIFKTINVSLNSGGNEKSLRSSPRFSKTSNSIAAKWVENSFENTAKGDSPKNSENEKTPHTKSGKPDSDTSNTSVKSPVLLPANKSANRNCQDQAIKSENRKSLKSEAEINGDSPKSSRRIHYIKIEVEGGVREECAKPIEDSSQEQDCPGSSSGRKRSSSLEVESADSVKKLKMEEENSEVPLEEEVRLNVELEMERRRRETPFKIRDIKTIVTECECRNKKWKETFSRYDWPARWGIPVVKNCSDKWDGKRIPPKLLHRYQKFLASNNMFHPVFLPGKLQAGDANFVDGEIGSQSSTRSECRDDIENELKDISEGSFIEDDSQRPPSENNLNASTSDSSGKMVLRNRSQQKPSVLDEDDFSSEDSDEWITKQKPMKKQKTNSKNRKSANQNKQLILKLEKCNINKRNENEEDRRNGSNINENYAGGLMMGTSGGNQAEGNTKSGPDPDTMVCPICSLRFKKQLIESHATDCASKTYKD